MFLFCFKTIFFNDFIVVSEVYRSFERSSRDLVLLMDAVILIDGYGQNVECYRDSTCWSATSKSKNLYEIANNRCFTFVRKVFEELL